MSLLFFGYRDIIVIAVVFLLLFGTRLPNVMRNLGRSVNSFKRGLKESADDDDETGGIEPPKGGSA